MSKRTDTRTSSTIWLSVGGLGLVLLLLFWLQTIYTSPENVFWGMFDNSLSSRGVERTVVQKNEGGTLKQTTLLRFGSDNAARSLVTLNQKTDEAKVIINTESLGTTEFDYNRYLGIETTQKSSNGQPLNFKPVMGVWGRSSGDDSQPAQLMSQTAFGMVPFANLNQNQRKQVSDFIRQKKVYQTDFSRAKTKEVNGQQAYLYVINLNPVSYIDMLRLLTKMTGMKPIEGLDPAAYNDSPPINLTFAVAKYSRQLIKVNYDNSSQEETYSGYGLVNKIEAPSSTVPLDKLQEQVQNIR